MRATLTILGLIVAFGALLVAIGNRPPDPLPRPDPQVVQWRVDLREAVSVYSDPTAPPAQRAAAVHVAQRLRALLRAAGAE